MTLLASPAPIITDCTLFRRPLPIANFRQIVSMLGDVELMLNQPVPQKLFLMAGYLLQFWHAVNHVQGQVQPVDFVQHRHIERRRGGSYPHRTGVAPGG